MNRIDFELPQDEPPSKKMAGMADFHPDLPQIPFFVGVIGPRHSGKTVLLYNLLKNKPGMYGNSFKKNNIILYSKTKDKDPTLKQLKLKYMYGPPTELSWIVQEIFKNQKAYQDADNMTGVLLVVDDATQLKSAWPSIQELAYTGRHDHIHVMYVAHKMSSIPRGVRTQTQQWIIFKPHEESEWQWILDMFSKKASKTIWQSALARAWQIPHNFAYIDYEEQDNLRRYRSGFHEPLFTPEEYAIIAGDGIEDTLALEDQDRIQLDGKEEKEQGGEFVHRKRCLKKRRKNDKKVHFH